SFDFANGLQVTGPPVITSVTTPRPDNQLSRNLITQTVTVLGTGFQVPPGLTASFGDPLVTGITVGEIRYTDATTFAFDVSVATNATLGARTLTATNGDGGVATFQVSVADPLPDQIQIVGLNAPASKTPTTTPPPPPAITSLTPSSGL